MGNLHQHRERPPQTQRQLTCESDLTPGRKLGDRASEMSACDECDQQAVWDKQCWRNCKYSQRFSVQRLHILGLFRNKPNKTQEVKYSASIALKFEQNRMESRVNVEN